MSIDRDNRTVISLLNEYITEHKRERIEQVLNNRTRYCTVVLEDIGQAHNASAVIRSCEVFGIQDVHIIENRHTYRAHNNVAKGAADWIDLIRYREPNTNNTTTAFDQLRAAGYVLVATSPHASGYQLHQLPLDRKIALVFGTEETGLSSYALTHADMCVTIPMYGFTQSFNISVSAAICLYAITTRLRQSSVFWQLTQDEKLAIKLAWLRKIVKGSAELERRLYSAK